jgi:hypothetical protein
MKVVKLPDGSLRVPVAISDDDYDADGTETIGPEDPRYEGYLPIALTEEEHARRDRLSLIANAELLARWSALFDAQQERQEPR